MEKPPYKITSNILKQVASISEKIGEINANQISKPSTHLRKQNKIRTIQSSLQIEGNTLSIDQVTAIIENKRVLGPEKDIKEVQNAVKVYDELRKLNSNDEKSFLNAHKILMNGLIEFPGKYRTKSVGIVKGSEVEHLAPPYENVPYLMKNLFSYLKSVDEIILIKSCVFHYEMEFIHPFLDGNGRMGRLWQTVILREKYPIFEFIPFETLISTNQEAYYSTLSKCDKLGESTAFIEYMLEIIESSLEEIIKTTNNWLSDLERLEYFFSITDQEFSRKDYIDVFKDISTATASRDLLKGVDLGLLKKIGEKNKTKYKIITGHNTK